MSIELHILLLCAKKKELRISDISHSDKCGVPRDVCISSPDRRVVCGYGVFGDGWQTAFTASSLETYNSSIYRILIRVNKNSRIKMDSKQQLQSLCSSLLIWYTSNYIPFFSSVKIRRFPVALVLLELLFLTTLFKWIGLHNSVVYVVGLHSGYWFSQIHENRSRFLSQ